MAFMEGKLQMIDLIGALNATRQQEQTEEERERMRLQNEMLRRQMGPKGRFDREPLFVGQSPSYVTPDPTAGMMTGEFQQWQRTKKPLSEMPGYIGGVSPEQYSAEQNAIRVAAAGSSGPRGGGGGQTQEEADLLGAQTNLAEEQARAAQYQRQGRGTATRDLLNQGALDLKQSEIQNRYPSPSTPEAAAALEYQQGQAGMAPVMEILAQREKAAQKGVAPENKEQAARDSELRKLRLSQLKGDSFDKLAPELQQAALDMSNDDRNRLFDIVGKSTKEQGDKLASLLPNIIGRLNPGDKINWGQIITVLTGK